MPDLISVKLTALQWSLLLNQKDSPGTELLSVIQNVDDQILTHEFNRIVNPDVDYNATYWVHAPWEDTNNAD